MGGRRADPGGLVAGMLFGALAVLFLYSAFTGRMILPFAYQVPAFATGLAVVLLLRILSPRRRR